MKLLHFFPILALLLCLISCSSFKSGLTIPAYQEFSLGETEKLGFSVKLENKSPFELQVETQDENGKRMSGFGLSPEGKTKVYVPANQKAVIRNVHPTSVNVAAEINRGVRGMTYQALDAEQLSNLPKLNMSDLELLIDQNWKGSLRYRDYSSNEMVEIPCKLKVIKKGESILLLEYNFPNEPKANDSQKVKIEENGRKLANQYVISKEKIDGKTIIRTLEEGKDNGEEVLFYYTYTFDKEQFEMKKEYQSLGSDELLFRNKYLFKR
ncbi:MAG: hypothetical protein MRY78_08875 [Saprospiraceae bacterium]|nr:hypothetical protein [Saprospiraceae bacterium]